jgi:Ankyrin repeats (3 copies)
MNTVNQILIDFELHSAVGIRQKLSNGIDPNGMVNGKPLFFELVNMYFRSPKFKECVRAFVDHGLIMEDKALLAILLNDATELKRLISSNPAIIHKTYTLQSTFTPLRDASLLHICVEYNHLDCAKVLVEMGVDVNLKAGVDKNGFGGHSPVFHAVNQHDNHNLDCLKFLLEKKTDISITVKGLIWGEGYEWETFIPSVNPISYAMMGLLRQFQRKEEKIYEVVSLLMKAEYGLDYLPPNIPNKYLQ